MIGYPIDPADLAARVEALVPGWSARAATRTAAFAAAGRYDEKDGIWSEIKEVYLRLQGSKCAYCERKLEGPELGAIEHDVEHFRPKNAVKRWPPKHWPPKRTGDGSTLRYGFATGDAWAEGYYLLAYALLNYATACKVCNSVLKSNYFPIYGSRGPQHDDPRDLATEQPLLIYPVGDIDEDPERLITFNGIVPIPRVKSDYRSYRARITIDFFVLEQRELLREERASWLVILWGTLEELRQATTSAEHAEIQHLVDRFLDGSYAHTNCLRAFHTLYGSNRAAAREIFSAARQYLSSLDGR